MTTENTNDTEQPTSRKYGTAQIQFRAGEMQEAIVARTHDGESVSRTAQRDLERYYALLKLSLPRFAEGEAALIVDALNGTLTEPHTASLLWANIADALEDGLDAKWFVDGEALVRRLRALTPFEALAVADASERFWRGGVYYADAPLADRLREVGLIAG